MPTILILPAILLALSVASAPAAEGVDLFGDPLPPGAVARLGTVRFRAGWGVTVAYAPHGSTLAAVGGDGILRLWDPDGREIRRFTAGRGELQALAFSADGKLVAATGRGENQAISVWNVETGQQVARLTGHEHYVTALLFLPDARRLISADDNGNVWLWSLETGRKLLDYAEHIGDVEGLQVYRLRSGGVTCNALAFSPGGELLYAAASGEVLVWNLATEQVEQRISLQGRFVASLSLAPGGLTLATGDYSKQAALWNTTTGELVHILAGHEDAVFGVAWSGDGELLATASRDGTVRIWDARTGKERQVLRGHEAGVFGVSFSPQGHRLVSASGDNTLLVWRVER